MTFVKWYDLEQSAREHQTRWLTRSKPERKGVGRKFFLIVPAFILLSLTAFSAFSNYRAGTTSSIVAPSAPPPTALPYVFVSPGNVAQLSVGSTFSIQVKVGNMTQFNGWDIQVYADPTVLNATSLSITGNDFAVNDSAGTPLEFTHCVNGKGTGCSSTDVKGIVHSAYQNSGILTGYGLLFTITYKVLSNTPGVSSTPYSPFALENVFIGDPNSTNGVTIIPVDGVYGFALTSGGSGGSHPWVQ